MALTQNEKRVLEFVREYVLAHKVYPTYREIQQHLKLRSINSISQYIKQLEYKGVLEINKNRGFRLHAEQKDQAELTTLIVLGAVQAGIPTDAGSGNETIKVPRSFVKNPDITFALRVRGNSMTDAGIHEGDIVIVEKRPKAFNRDIVVALVNGENTVKRYVKNDDGSRYLRAESREFEDILPDGDWELQGIVVGLWRQY